MHMLAELVDLVIGVDTHKHTHTAAVVQAVSGGVITQATVPAIPAGYQQLLRLADRSDPPDATSAAREALGRDQLASPAPPAIGRHHRSG